jgi:lipopolysaccharide transport system ATP-binding protein
MSDLAIQIVGLSKRYRIDSIREQYPTLRDALVRTVLASLRAARSWASGRNNETKPGWIWALRDVNLEVNHGEVLGIIGRNGAGKSTLLRVLTGITEPTGGFAELYGRVGSLLEVGTGFHMELTGRENIYMNGALLGMRRHEIKRKFDEIVAFSGVEGFLDTPVKRYSSGMYMRLAFSVAAHLDPEILLVDEVLAVGDVAFQKKCLGKMGDVAHEGRTILFVSHNMAAIQALCEKTLWLDAGGVVACGPTSHVVQKFLGSTVENQKVLLADRKDRSGDGSARICSLSIAAEDGQPVIQTNSRLKITVDYRSDRPLHKPRVYVSITDMYYSGIYALDSDATADLHGALPARGTLTCVTDPINLTPGRCYANVALFREGVKADQVEAAAIIDIESGLSPASNSIPDREWVICTIGYRWSLTNEEP